MLKSSKKESLVAVSNLTWFLKVVAIITIPVQNQRVTITSLSRVFFCHVIEWMQRCITFQHKIGSSWSPL